MLPQKRGDTFDRLTQIPETYADGSGSGYATALAQASVITDAAPANWGTVDFSQFSASSPPSIRFRAV